MVSFPYHSHIFRDSYGSGMGIVWEAYHKGVPENPIDLKMLPQFLKSSVFSEKMVCLSWYFIGSFDPQYEDSA